MTWNNNDNNAGGGSTPPPPPPPPPPGGFGSPPPTPPPGGGNFGGPPPPPPGGGNFGGPGQPAGQPGSLDAMLALKQSWELFKKNWVVMIAPLFVYVLLLVLAIESLGVANPIPPEVRGNDFLEALAGMKQLPPFVDLIFRVLQVIVTIGMYNAFIRATRGEKVTGALMFSGFNWVVVFLVAIVATFASLIGLAGCLIAVFATTAIFQFALPSALNGSSFGDSLSETWNLGTKNFGGALAVVGLQAVVFISGALACCVGLVAAMPVICGMAVCAYRQLRGEPIQIEQPGM